MKEIIYFVGEYPKIANAFINTALRELKRQGVEVALYSLNEPENPNVFYEGDYVFKDACYVKRETTIGKILFSHLYFLIKIPRLYFSLWLDVFGGRINWKIFIKYIWVARSVEEKKTDLINAFFVEGQTVIAMICARLLNLPFTFQVGGTDCYLERPREFSAIIDNSAKFFVCSSELKTRIGQQFKLDPDKIVMNMEGIEISRFGSIKAEAHPVGTILFVGRQVRHKGVPLLLEAASRLKQRGSKFKVVIVGDGQDWQEFKELAKKLNAEDIVSFAGAVRNLEIVPYYQNASFFVLPSSLEGSPVVIMEAMASGLPVISTKVSGIPDMITDGYNGFLIDPGDVDALTEKIEYFLSNPDKVREMGQNAKANSTRFDIRNQTVNLIKTWEQILNEKIRDR